MQATIEKSAVTRKVAAAPAAPKAPAAAAAVRPVQSRNDEIVARSVAAMRFPLQRAYLKAGSLRGVDISNFFSRAWFVEQAVRVRVTEGKSAPQVWWLRSAIQTNADGVESVTLGLVRTVSADGSILKTQEQRAIEGLQGVVSCGYSAGAALYGLELSGANSSVVMDFDANLADQTHRGAWHADWKLWFDANLPRGFNWASWMQSRIEKPTPAAGTGSTFEESLARLRQYLDGQRAGRKGNFTPLVAHNGDRDLYAFMERIIGNARQGLALPSQIERISALGFNFGKAEENIGEILKHVVSDGYAQRRRTMAPYLALPTKGELLEFEANASEEGSI